VYVYDVQLEDGSIVTVTLDSGAGCSVWPRGKASGGAKLEPKKPGMKMSAANGTEIGYYGQRMVKFRAIDAAGLPGRSESNARPARLCGNGEHHKTK